MRILIVGLGSIGRRHLANLRTLRPDAHITVWRQYGQRSVPDDVLALSDCVVTRLEDALEERPEAAILANPATLHCETGVALSNEGIHLFVEKPISHALESARTLVDSCRKQNLVLAVGYTFRFYRPLQIMQRALHDNHIGAAWIFRAEACRYLPEWRAGTDYRQNVSARSELGGGVLLELSHEIDYARWLMGEIRSVSAQVERVGDLEIDVEDAATLLLTFGSGSIGTIHLNMIERPALRGCRIAGALGTLTWDAGSHSVRQFRAASDNWSDLYAGSAQDYSDAYKAEMEQFLSCVEERATAAVTGEDALRTLEVIDAAKRSGIEHRAVML
jgi:predicted dehydrogenase